MLIISYFLNVILWLSKIILLLGIFIQILSMLFFSPYVETYEVAVKTVVFGFYLWGALYCGNRFGRKGTLQGLSVASLGILVLVLDLLTEASGETFYLTDFLMIFTFFAAYIVITLSIALSHKQAVSSTVCR